MIEITGDIWEELCHADALIVPTNGQVRKDGKAVMGAGFALAVRDRWPGTDLILAEEIRQYGNRVNLMGVVENGPGKILTIFSFPTKEHWKDPSDLGLIVNSMLQLKRDIGSIFPEWKKILMPRVGCGKGGLQWESVRPILQKLDDRFYVVHPEEI